MNYRAFHPARPVREYGFVDGQPVLDETTASGYLLPWEALDDQAQAVATRRAPAYVVVGEFIRPNGTRYPELGVTTQHIEANTSYRWDPNTKTLRLVCQVCGLKDGKHERGCDRA